MVSPHLNTVILSSTAGFFVLFTLVFGMQVWVRRRWEKRGNLMGVYERVRKGEKKDGDEGSGDSEV